MGMFDQKVTPVETENLGPSSAEPKKGKWEPDVSNKDAADEWKSQANSPHVWLEIPFLNQEDTIVDVFVGINGVQYHIKKGVKVPVPTCVVHALENAEVSGIVPVADESGNMMKREIKYKRFPYIVHGPASPEEVAKWKSQFATLLK